MTGTLTYTRAVIKGTTLFVSKNEWSVHEQSDLAGSRKIQGTEQTLTNDRYVNFYLGCYKGTTVYLLAKMFDLSMNSQTL